MISAFGVDHGEFSKGFNPVKALKAGGSRIVDRSAAKNFKRGHSQAMISRGEAPHKGSNFMPSLGVDMPGFKRARQAYSHGQAAGKKTVHDLNNPMPDPFR